MSTMFDAPTPLASPDLSKYSTTNKSYIPMNQLGHLDLDEEDMDLLADAVDAAGLLAVPFDHVAKQRSIDICDSVLLDLFVLRYHERRIRVYSADLDPEDGRLKLYFVHHEVETPVYLN